VVRFYSSYYYCGTTDETINDRRRCSTGPRTIGNPFSHQTGSGKKTRFVLVAGVRSASGWVRGRPRSLSLHTLSRSLAQTLSLSLSLCRSLSPSLSFYHSPCRANGGDVTKGREKSVNKIYRSGKLITEPTTTGRDGKTCARSATSARRRCCRLVLCVRARPLAFACLRNESEMLNVAPSQNTAERASWSTRVVAGAGGRGTFGEFTAVARHRVVNRPRSGSAAAAAHSPKGTASARRQQGSMRRRPPRGGSASPPPTVEPCEKVSGTRVPVGGRSRVAARGLHHPRSVVVMVVVCLL